MPLKIRERLKKANWTLILAAPVAAGILHICATLAAPHLTAASAYSRLVPALPINKMEILSTAEPGTEPLPFLSPDARYAMCRFDARSGPVTVSASLPPEPGWILSVISPQGDNVYAAASTAGRSIPISIALVPSEDHFLGVTPEARGIARNVQPPVPVAITRGIVVVRGPDNGFAYRGALEDGLRQASCTARSF